MSWLLGPVLAEGLREPNSVLLKSATTQTSLVPRQPFIACSKIPTIAAFFFQEDVKSEVNDDTK